MRVKEEREGGKDRVEERRYEVKGRARERREGVEVDIIWTRE